MMSSSNFTPHPYLKDLPRGFTTQVYDQLDEAKKRNAIDYIPAQQTPTAGWFDLENLFQHERFKA
jgi:hypothetical protein